MAAVTICSDFGAQKIKVWHCFPLFPHLFPMKWWDRMPWSSFSECWALSQLFHSPLSLSSRYIVTNFLVIRPFQIYHISSFQIFILILLIIFTMLYITFLCLICFKTGHFYLLICFTYFTTPHTLPLATTNLFSVSRKWWCCFLNYTYK